MNPEQRLDRLESKLDTLIRLLALNVSPADQPLLERAQRLHKAGLPPKEIAAVLNSNPHSVINMLSRARKAKRRKA
jgi:DNA-directed RNA polymerase specialized sigma24 family protein